MYKVICPIYITLPRKTKKDRKVSINLNAYRNWDFRVSNIVKIKFKEMIKEQIIKLPKFNKIKLEFILYRPTRRKGDRSNVHSIVEKFFCDALVEFEKLEDDNDNFIESSFYRTAPYEKNNGRVEVIITSL